jgi:hypothetical protein
MTQDSILGPLPSVGFKRQVVDVSFPPIYSQYKGTNFQPSWTEAEPPLAMMTKSGSVVNVEVALRQQGSPQVGQSGEVEVDVRIDGTSIFTTQDTCPRIAYVSGEDFTLSKNTLPERGDTGITRGVIDGGNNSFEIGDMLEFWYRRRGNYSSSPKDLMILVELAPT